MMLMMLMMPQMPHLEPTDLVIIGGAIVLVVGVYLAVVRDERHRDATAVPDLWARSLEHYRPAAGSGGRRRPVPVSRTTRPPRRREHVIPITRVVDTRANTPVETREPDQALWTQRDS